MNNYSSEDSHLGFVKSEHIQSFTRATQIFNVYILVRKTGEASLKWVGRSGYTAKRADLKCKTAKQDVGRYQLAGLVCSPLIHPLAFGKHLDDAYKYWFQSQYLVTTPKTQSGFDDSDARRCLTPYILQNDPNHKHYGCLAFVECGLLTPKYVHGDYDLYAIIPAETPWKKETRRGNLSTPMHPSSLTLVQQLELQKAVPNVYGPRQFEVMNWLDQQFGYPMVMHGEQENIGHKDDEVIAFLPSSISNKPFIVLSGEMQIRRFYQQELEGRQV